jgi:hypothetical protein
MSQSSPREHLAVAEPLGSRPYSPDVIRRRSLRWYPLPVMFVAAAACAAPARLPVSAGTGPQPVLPPPRTAVIPLINVVTAKGWPVGAKPVSAPGTTVNAFAT